MNKKIIKYIIIGVVLIVAAFFYSHISKMNLIYDKDIDNSEYFEVISTEADEIAQSFICSEKHLDGISIKLRILNPSDKDTVKVSILDPDGKELAAAQTNTSKLKNGKFNKIKFERINDTKDKNYTIKLSFDIGTDENSIVWFYHTGTVKNTKLIRSAENIDGTMIIKTFTDRFDFETFVLVLCVIAFIVAFLRVLYKLFK